MPNVAHKIEHPLQDPRDDTLVSAQLAAEVTTGLDVYFRSSAMPWTPRRAAHLLRRAGFGFTSLQLDQVAAGIPLILDARRTARGWRMATGMHSDEPPPNGAQNGLDLI